MSSIKIPWQNPTMLSFQWALTQGFGRLGLISRFFLPSLISEHTLMELWELTV